jgi:hypothetical protein
MARRWKRWAMLAGGLLCLGSLPAPASAQGPGYQPLTNQRGDSQGAPPGDEFPRLGAAQPAPNGPPPNPLSYDYRGTPNGFSEEDQYAEPIVYVFKLRGEFLLYHVGKPNLNTVIATTTNAPNLATSVGAIGEQGTTSLLGPGSYDYRQMNGGRFTTGFATGALPPIEISGFWIDKPALSLLDVSSNGSANSAVLARPFRAPNLPSLDGLGQQVVLSAGFPGFLAGNINVAADLSMWGLETNAFFNLGTSDVAGVDVIVGYRYSDLTESLAISNSLRSITNALNVSFNAVNLAGLPMGFTTTASDRFKSRNQFNGATLGLRSSLYVGQVSAMVDMKLALGGTHQTLNVGGTSSLISPDGSVQTVPGGLLAVASNSGNFTADAFSVIPELNVNVGFNITPHFKLFATYNIFAWTNVVRPGDQLNNRVDSRQVPTDPTFTPGFRAATPPPPFSTTNFWGHGLSLGVEIGF